MQKMLKSYTGLDKKFITEGPWAQVGSVEQLQQVPLQALETQKSNQFSVKSDVKEEKKVGAGADQVPTQNISDVTYARLQLKNSLAKEKPFKVEYVMEVPEALKNRVNRAY